MRIQQLSAVLGLGLIMGLSASATLYVDYNLSGNVSVSRDADIGEGSVVNNGDIWNFSDTTALAPSAGGTNDVIYGGVITSWSVASDYNPVFQHQSNGFQLQIGDQGGTQAATGTFVWKQEDFLNGGDSGTVSLGAGSTITINLAEAGDTDYRAVVNQGGTYYVGESVASDTADAVFDLTNHWAVLNTTDYTYGAFSALTLDDVRGVGVWFDQSRTGLTRFRIQDFQLTMSNDGFAAPIELAGLFSSGCVLQRDQVVPVWGTCEPGETITVSVNAQSKQTVADTNGNWRVELDPESAGGPYTLTVSGADSDPVVLTDVYFGDVWLLTGQSNMFLLLRSHLDGDLAVYYPGPAPNAGDDFDDVRFAIVNTIDSTVPEDDVVMSTAWTRWEASDLDTMSIVGYYFTRALNEALDANGMSDVPLGIIKVCKGATAAEQWISAEALAAMSEPLVEEGSKPPSVYYNGMIAPMQDYAFKGALWYQGEGNSRTHDRQLQYTLVKQTLIESWREQWGFDFPFYYVQLAPYMDFVPVPADDDTTGISYENWAWTREAQTELLDAVSNAAMACIIDIGFQDNIHPPYKDIVGQRLAQIALADTYGFDLVSRGPTVSDVVISNSSVTITFDNVADGLRTQAVDAQPDAEEIANIEIDLPVSVSSNVLAGFALCGSDQTFYWATDAEIISTNQVRIANPVDVQNPVNVRYAWQSFPRCNLFNSEGLPAEPFRTDTYDYGTSSGGELTAPRLMQSMTTTNAMIEWQPVSTDWALESTGNLTNSWVEVPNSRSNTSASVALQDTSFFRLKK